MRYPCYPEYKPSGVEWLGDVPAHWGFKRLKFASACINDKQDALPDGLEYVAMEHIESWTGKRLETENGVTPESQTNRFRRGDVLFGKLRPYLAKAWLANRDGVCSTELLVLRERDLEPAYLRYWTLMRSFVEVVDGSTYGSKMPRASWNFIGNVLTLIPERDEQRAIAAFLDHETSLIDTLIAKKQRLLELLAEKRTALISQAVTKGLNPDAPMKDSGIEWLGDIPAHWRVSKLAFLSLSLQTGPFGSQLHSSEYVDDGVPVINPANIQDGSIVPDTKATVAPEVFARLRRHELQRGDIIFGRRGEMGRCGLVTETEAGWLCGTGSLRVRLDRTIVYPGYMLALLSMRGVADYLSLNSVGSTMENLNTKILGSIPVVVPPLSEQSGIARFASLETDRWRQIVERVESAIAVLSEYRSSLITSAVTGKIDIRDIVQKREMM